MEFTNEQKQTIKKLQKLILSNVISCEDDVRPKIIARFKDVKYRILSEEEIVELNIADTALAFFERDLNEVCFRPNIEQSEMFEHILLHEMLHAHAFKDGQTGFEISDVEIVNGNRDYAVVRKKYSMFNEAATEYYACMFDGREPISYSIYVPIYAHLSEMCGFEKLMTTYFSNNEKQAIDIIKNTYHLKSDYLVKKLLMLMDQSYNLEYGFKNISILKEAYKVLLEMNIEKICFEQKRQLSNSELLNVVDFNKIINVKNMSNPSVVETLMNIRYELKDFTKNFVKTKETNFEKTAQIVDEFVFNRLKPSKEIDYNIYKEYFKKNLCDVILYLDQNNYYFFAKHLVSNDLAINEVLHFIHDENEHINLSHLSKKDKHYVVNSIANGCKHGISNLENQFYPADVMREMEDNFNC